MYTQAGEIKPVPPFDFGRSLEFLGHFSPIRGEQTVGAERLVKAVRVADQTVAFALHSTGKVEQPSLAYTLYSKEPLDEPTQQAALDRIRFFLSLDDDLKPFYRLAEDDPAFEPIVKGLYGYHQVKFLTPFENACWAILSQRNLMTVALRQKQNLTAQMDNCLTVEGEAYRAFPDADQLSSLPTSQINDIIKNERKAECLSAVASAFNRADEQWLRTATYAEVEKWLRSIKGIGEWSASFVLLRGLGRMEGVLVGEAKLQEAAGQLYRHGHPASLTDLQKLAQPYGQWRGYWAHYLRVGM